MAALTAGAIASFSVNGRVAAVARVLSAVLLLAALMLFAIVALRHGPALAASRRPPADAGRGAVPRRASYPSPSEKLTVTVRMKGVGTPFSTSG
jgi:hypothetical protein